MCIFECMLIRVRVAWYTLVCANISHVCLPIPPSRKRMHPKLYLQDTYKFLILHAFPLQVDERWFVVCVQRVNAVWYLEQQLRPFVLSSTTYKQALSCQ